MSREQLPELLQRAINLAGFRVFHGKAVTGEGIVGVLRKNFV
jgi:hypothetical protein